MGETSIDGVKKTDNEQKSLVENKLDGRCHLAA